MRGIAVVFGLALLLGGLALASVRVDTDARALLGADAATAGALDTPEGRALTLAIVHPDRAFRTAIAHEVSAALPADPMVARVTLAPAPSQAVLDWLWRHRFALAPPAPEALAPEAMAAELRRARQALTDAAAAPFAARYLLDPTGSFRRLVEALAASPGALSGALPVHDGVPQARDDSAALVFVELAALPFDTSAQAAFDARLRAQVAAAGAEALLVGPRTISAATSAEIAERSSLCTLLASALLLLWLAVALRSARGILACLSPPALGAAVGVLVVQLAFGSVHVLALGFGGALMGLALDYPLHLMAHGPGPQAAHARRCVRIGAATTAIAFLALVVADIPAIAQVGVFVASGLLAAAGSALWLGAALPAIPGTTFAIRGPRLRHKWAVLAGVGGLAALGIWLLPSTGTERLAELSAAARADIARLDRMLELPSGRHRVEVSGASLTEVLDRQSRLAAVLERARAEAILARFDMLSTHLPDRAAGQDLPPPEELSAALPAAVAEAGLRPGFRADVVEAYRQAIKGSDVRPADLSAVDLPAVAGIVRREGEVIQAPALLWDVEDPEALAEAVAALHDPAIRFVDRGAEIVRGFDRLAARVRICVAIGAAAALAFLLAAVGRVRVVAEIAAGCAAAALVTACLAGLVGGGLGIFQVMALALVVGIGIDYGLLLTLSGDDAQFGAAARSVVLCATTTLIAFIIMAFSGVGVLEDIGTTVSIGVVAMLAAGAVRSGGGGGGREGAR